MTLSSAPSPYFGSPPPVFGKRSRNRHGGAPAPTESTMLVPTWDDPSRPAGSGFSQEEWAAARAGGHHAVEVLGANERTLLRFPLALDPAQGHWLPSLFGQVFDGCMLIAPGARPQYPGLVREKAVIVNGQSSSFGVIEPYVMPNEWCRGSTFAWDSKLPLETLRIIASDCVDEDCRSQGYDRPTL